MRVKNEEFDLLVEICKYLSTDGNRKDLATALEKVISRFSIERQKANDRQRIAHAKNRENGYAWSSSYHPKKSKYLKGEENGIRKKDSRPLGHND